MATPWRGVIEEYRSRLPVTDATPVVTLQEGGTPLIRSEALSAETGCEVFLKFEGANPTGSFKDRGMTLAMSKAAEEGSKAVVCASTGNTSASAAAYAGKAGLTCAVLVPRGKVAVGKLAQTLIHGARVLEVEGNFDAALEVARDLAERYPVTLVNSVNPFRLQGQKTCAFEICDALGRAPDIHCTPGGNAGNISSHWLGYSEYAADGTTAGVPRLFGFQAVSDREILNAYRRVAREGVFCEMASAASVAGLLRLAAAGTLEAGSTVVCVLTGHGLKDPDWAMAFAARPPVVAADPAAVAAELGL